MQFKHSIGDVVYFSSQGAFGGATAVGRVEQREAFDGSCYYSIRTKSCYFSRIHEGRIQGATTQTKPTEPIKEA